LRTMLDRLILPALPVLPGERVILRDSTESDVDDRLRHPIDPEEAVSAAAATRCSRWSTALRVAAGRSVDAFAGTAVERGNSQRLEECFPLAEASPRGARVPGAACVTAGG
jgi:hypothetical protein